jgi:hypothetical protein
MPTDWRLLSTGSKPSKGEPNIFRELNLCMSAINQLSAVRAAGTMDALGPMA